MQARCTFADDQVSVRFLSRISQLHTFIVVFELPSMIMAKRSEEPTSVIGKVGAAAGIMDPPQEILVSSSFNQQTLKYHVPSPIWWCCVVPHKHWQLPMEVPPPAVACAILDLCLEPGNTSIMADIYRKRKRYIKWPPFPWTSAWHAGEETMVNYLGWHPTIADNRNMHWQYWLGQWRAPDRWKLHSSFEGNVAHSAIVHVTWVKIGSAVSHLMMSTLALRNTEGSC